MLVSADLDLSMSLYLQFTARFGCDDVKAEIPAEHSVVVQFSNNGGILWQFVDELNPADARESRCDNASPIHRVSESGMSYYCRKYCQCSSLGRRSCGIGRHCPPPPDNMQEGSEYVLIPIIMSRFFH